MKNTLIIRVLNVGAMWLYVAVVMYFIITIGIGVIGIDSWLNVIKTWGTKFNELTLVYKIVKGACFGSGIVVQIIYWYALYDKMNEY